MSNLVTKNFNNAVVTFDLSNDVMINLTEMAKANGKRTNDWLSLPSTQSYLTALKNFNTGKSGSETKQELIVKNGGNNPGTWGSRRVAIRLAQWLSDEFAIWVDTQIEELLIKGTVSIQQPFKLPDFTNPVIAARAWADEVEKKQIALALIEEQKPLVEFANNVANTASSITIHGFAAILSKDKINIGEKRLFQWFRDNGYLTKNNIVTQYAKDGGWLKTIEKTRVCAKTNSIVPYAQTLVTGKGQLFFAKKLMNEFKNKEN